MKEKDLIRFMDRMIEERKAEYALGTAHIYQASRNALSAFLKAHDIPFKRVRPRVIEAVRTVSQTAGKQLEHGVYLYAGARGCL